MIGQPSQCSFKAHNDGFTLIELMVVIVIAAILLTIAVPSFDNLIKRNNIDSLQSKLSSALSTARTEAASRNKVVTICSSTDEETCKESDEAWSSGWVIFEDGGELGKVDENDVLIDVYRNTGSYSINAPSGVKHLSFNSQGFMLGGSNTLFTLCDPKNDDAYARGLFVTTSGLVMKTKDTNDDGKHNDPTSGDTTTNLSCPSS